MCGIAGVWSRNPERARDAVARMTSCQAHRGPDAEGVEIHPFGTGWLGLGHRRLAILDLSPLGRQPMHHPASGAVIVFNGEIYNFHRLRKDLEREGEHFVSGSDTEVLLAGIVRHGPRFVERLEGMYAFAHFDPRAPTLTLARDPAGIKPLYVAEEDGCLLFASEVRAILASGLVSRRISLAGLGGLMAYGSVPQPYTLFDQVRMFPAGAWQTVAVDGTRSGQPCVWWRPPTPEPAAAEPELIHGTRDLLDAAVHDHLISDVPVGVFLSAGIDSAIVAGLAARHSKSIHAFTVAVSSQGDLCELDIAAETARRMGLPHSAIQIPSDTAKQYVSEWLTAADQPSMDGLNTFIISKAVRAAGVTVALSGLGADELFGGYETFRDVPRLGRLRRAVRCLPAIGRRAVAGVLAARRPATSREKLADVLAGPNGVLPITLGRRRLLSDRQLAELGLSSADCGLTANWIPPETEADLATLGSDTGWAVSVIESRVYQTNTLLRDSDANAMAHGLEIRVPFLDQRLLGYLHRLPGSARFPRGQPPKHLLCKAAADLLYPDLLARPKTGFTLPLRQWMTGPLRPLCEDAILALKKTGLVRPAGVDAVWTEFLGDTGGRAWSRALVLVALGDYLHRHGGAAA